jgi:hypothetical protein
MSDWVSFNKPVEINVWVIIKRRRGKYDKWEYTEINRSLGDWHDLVYELFSCWQQFQDEVAHLSKRSAKHERLDLIAERLSKADMPHEFVLPDGTDDWYVAYCKPAIFRIDSDGGLR